MCVCVIWNYVAFKWEHHPLYKHPWNITEMDFILDYKEISKNLSTKQKQWGHTLCSQCKWTRNQY